MADYGKVLGYIHYTNFDFTHFRFVRPEDNNGLGWQTGDTIDIKWADF